MSRRRQVVMVVALALAASFLLVDVVAPAKANSLLDTLFDPASGPTATRLALRTGALAGLVVALFTWIGVRALMAVPLLAGPLLPAALPVVTGDEPHYLMMTVSLQQDHDLAIVNNHNEGDGAVFGYPALGPTPGQPVDSLHSLHYPGTSALALPGWILGGRRWALLGIGLVGALLIREMAALARALGARPSSAALAAAAVTCTPPVLLLMRQFYPDIVGALFLTHLARLLAESEGPDRGNLRAWAPWTAAAVAGAAPWFHARLLPGVVVLVVVLAVRQPRMRVIPPAALIGSLAVMAVEFQRWYGSPLPNAPYVHFPVRGPSPLRGLVGMFADSHAGLVLVAPVVVVALVALPRVWARSRLWCLVVGAVVLGAIAQNSAFNFWHAGYSTPARPWAALLPLGTGVVALAIERIPRAMAGAGVVTGLMAVTLLGLPSNAYPVGTGLTALWAHFDLTFLPVIDATSRAEHVGNTPLVWCAVALLALTAGLLASARALAGQGGRQQHESLAEAVR